MWDPYCWVWALLQLPRAGATLWLWHRFLIAVASLAAEHGLQGAQASAVAAHGLSCSAVCGIFPGQGLSLWLLHWQTDSHPLSHWGNPPLTFWNSSFQDINVFEKSVPSTTSLSVDLCDCFLIIRLRIYPTYPWDLSIVKGHFFSLLLTCNLGVWKGLALSVFHPMVLAFIDDPFLNQLLEWWLQNSGISITELANGAISWLKLAVFIMKFLAYRYFFQMFCWWYSYPWMMLTLCFFFKLCALYPLFSKISAASLQSRIHHPHLQLGLVD